MKLFIVATPIGNLSDLTTRAAETLGTVDAIVCEDTRVTGKILQHLGIKKPMIAINQHASEARIAEALKMLKEGKSLALTTDAGTPAISDPGGKFVEAAIKALGDELQIIPIPGACAAIAALSISGWPADKFLFLGFPPHKNGRKAYFAKIAATEETVCFYESTHRILKTLEELGDLIGERKLVVGRELTKLHETIYRGTSSEVTKRLKEGSIKGEFVIVVCPKSFT
ncbi:MAG: 16S rRNA (cytidine(1402)-2'-O)-methyltransferase [Patescibacteria group bacterium]|jgi:16S rRNA (cytidine1402-2'-O)-methyltransferase